MHLQASLHSLKILLTNHLRHIAVLVATVVSVTAGSLDVKASALHVIDEVNDSTGNQVNIVKKPSRPIRPERRHTSPITTDTFAINEQVALPDIIVGDSLTMQDGHVSLTPIDSIAVTKADMERRFTFNPDPTRAVWLSALCPGLGQLYNRRYWKLPIVVGAFMGLGYATNWNNTMLRDYTTAYSDIMDNDPTTKSYMDFFAPTVNEADLDKAWLTNILRTRKNYYRRNRDLCIICMIGVYLVAMVDAYVDAQLAHFDISTDLSMDLAPTLMNNDIRSGTSRPSIGLYWALNF